ncbi:MULTISPECIES: beta-ketoacyl-[acyl-carrier-protein] synthase family protein [unclassified Streptomyces]|uniref:beta-ketoacyl-[acyl-carrier-protein] synthase family protein n=1 Tax=unclassified Streptomyces TaxID=2593676 RepID=UPI0025549E32|nr:MULTISPECIES: beta-ketoacyl-[acyl-carrier-protein] synthase family protein [unclassified Streptomyces]WRZ69505.1 beta-ketoacyl-[acyl-carrier-protein] synthase family protein [Streptomyces sp. NBC_01257]WSU63439.1 beta-ketoacyl-[acyl-carrier-protein] synthase family protein [Streptomyces sp. NBC_01104]
MTAGSRAVAVTGLGMITPAGVGREATWQGVLRGESTAARDSQLKELPTDFSCRIPPMRAGEGRIGGGKAWRMARFSQLAVLAAREAVADAGLDPKSWDGTRVAVVIGSGLAGAAHLEEQTARLLQAGPDLVSPVLIPMLISNMAAGEVLLDLGARGPSLATETACASGASALAVARDLLLSGACDIAVAGGTEAAVSPVVTTGFQRMGALSSRTGDPAAASRPFAADRDGFVISEGAAILVLERVADARARGRSGYAQLAGAGLSSDAHHPTAPAPGGTVAETALRNAVAEAGLSPSDIDHVNAHGTSTPLNDSMEAELIDRVLPHRPSITAAKGVLGHSLGAAGAIEAALTALTIHRSTVPPIANLTPKTLAFPLRCVMGEPRQETVRAAASHSFGFGGHNVVLVLRSA